MARQPRLAVAGLPHLVRLVGHAGDAVFRDDADRRLFLGALRESARQHPAAVHAYALLDDEIWLLLTPVLGEGLGRLMQGLGRRYVAGFNRRHGRSGSLWAGRFRAAVVQPGGLAHAALLAIDLLALQRGKVPCAGDYVWSSARHHLGLVRDPLVTLARSYWELGNTPFEREASYRRLIDDGLNAADMQRVLAAAHSGWALGDPAFLRDLAQSAGRPVAARPRGRPRRA